MTLSIFVSPLIVSNVVMKGIDYRLLSVVMLVDETMDRLK